MALTTGINNVYSSAFKALPQKAIPLGSPSTVYEPLTMSTNEAGILFTQYFEYIMPVGFGYASATNYDVLHLCTLGGNYSNLAGNTVIPGLRLYSVSLTSSGNAGNTVPVFIGWAQSNNLTVPNVTGATPYIQGGAVVGTGVSTTSTGSTLIQSANTVYDVDVPAGNTTNISAPFAITPLIQTDDLVLVATRAAALATSTQITLQCRVTFYLTGPTGY